MFPSPSTILSTLSIILLFPSTILAIPCPSPQVRRQSASSSAITPTQLLQIAPSSGTCAGAPYPAECRTAAQAAPVLTSSFQKYGITSAAEKAALISLMAFESGDFKYNKNYYPGTPGQGSTSSHPSPSSTFDINIDTNKPPPSDQRATCNPYTTTSSTHPPSPPSPPR